MSPIDTLPGDVLVEIFTSTLPALQPDITELPVESSSVYDWRISPRTLLYVCRFWRDVVLSAPALWAQWTFCLTMPSENELQKTTYFVQQCLARSGNAPISFCMRVWTESGLEEVNGADVELYRVVLSSQRRWRRVILDVQSNMLIDPGQLALAPLSELQLYGMNHKLTGVMDTVVLDKLRVVCLRGCHASYLNLLSSSIAPNLEELSFQGMQSDEDVPETIPFLRLEQIRRLTIITSGAVLRRISCPGLLQLDVRGMILAPLLSFVEINRPPLHSLVIIDRDFWETWPADGGRSLVSTLRLLPCLMSLRIDILLKFDQLFLNAMSTMNASDGEPELCPELQDMVLRIRFRDIDSEPERLVGLIESRWRAPNRSIRSIHLAWAGFNFTCSGPSPSDCSDLSGAWGSVARCIEEGLVFEAEEES